jgi:hypothetical protein
VKFDDGWYLIEMKSLMDGGPILPPQLLLLHSSDMAPSAVFFSFLLCRSCDCRLKRRQQETTIVPGQKFSILFSFHFYFRVGMSALFDKPPKKK